MLLLAVNGSIRSTVYRRRSISYSFYDTDTTLVFNAMPLVYSTVTLLAKFLGLSTSLPRSTDA